MTMPSLNYEQFLRNKAIVANPLGIEIDPDSLHPCLKHHQREMVLWMCRMGRAACFASFGLGKTVIQLETVRQVRDHAGGMGLIVAPLGVRGEFMRDATMLGIDLKFIRNIEEADDSSGIYITNYETIRDGKLDPRAFTVSSLDEAAVLRGFGSTLTFREFMRVFDGIRYKFIATATPSPNEYIELLAYSAYLEVMEVGEGKAQPLDAKILTPAGWVSMGDILEGDDVIAGDGSITKVIGVYPQGEQDIYRLTCNDGATTECTSEHLWLTTTHYERNNLKRYKDRNPDGERKYASVKTTAEILETLKVKKGINHVIPKPNPVFQYRRPITINPYLLGALIGDACLRKTSVVFSTGDDWMSDTVEKLLPEGLFLRRIKPELGDFSITATGKQGGNGPGSNVLLQNLRDYGLLGKRSFEKFIPVDYLESSEEDRLNMLRGLMDTDGTIGKKSQQTTFSTTSYKLAQDVVYLVRSLGGTASIRNDSVCSLTRNQAYIVEVRLDVCPFMMPRKAALHKKRNIRATSRYVTGVEMIGRKEAQCIAVEHPSQLYVTDDFIVTHNTRFFKRDSTKADKLTLHAHKEREFWLWVSSWALFVQTPSDIGGDDTGYALPELRVHWHEIPAEHTGGQKDEHGQSLLFDAQAMGLQGAAKEKRESLERRVAKAREIVQNSLDPQCVIWCDLNAEQDAIGKMLKAEGISMSSLYGSQGIDEREKLMDEWRAGERQAFISKPQMYGSGCNLQRCHTMIFTGIGFRFADFIQACHRIHRFQQSHDCDVHLIYTENERQVRQILERKWAQHITLTRNMSGIIKEFGLDNLRRAEAMSRALGVEREEAKTDHFHVIHNDTVLETRSMMANSVGLILTSVPFSNQYEYSPNYSDFGHSDNNEHFFEQMDYLTPELLRVLKPGRMAVIHVKDRIVPGGMTGLGFQTVYPFHARCIDHYTRHGFGYMGMKTIVTDVVRENNQTYRLGWTEQCKDGTKMGVGMPEYLLLFRKPQSDTSRAYTDDPVTKPKPLVFATDEDRKQPWEQRKRAAFKASDKRPCVRGTGYSRARWQIDAHGFARSSGDRFPTTEEIRNMPHAAIFKAFRKWGLENIYEYEQHVGIGEDMEEDARLPVSFMLLQPPSWHPEVWTDIARMRCLNGEQKHKGKTMHLCLARDSRVLTKDHGYIPIQEVSCLDQVLTHKGRWRPVLQVKNTGVQPVITVKAQGVPGLTLTPDHNLWTRKSDWARSRDGAERAEPTWIEAQHTLSAYLNQNTPPVEFTDSGDETLWWTVGRWLADGHIDSHGGAILSIGRDKWDEFVSKAGRFVVNTPYEGTALQVLLTDPQRELRNILEHCGSGAGNKHLPPAAFVLPFEQARALIEGYLSGDGHFIPERNSWQASSISRDLLLGLSILVQRVYQAIPSIFAGRPDREHVIEGRTVQARQEWGMAFSINDSRKRPFILEDGAWKKVSSLTDAGEAETWCLKVEEDESFTAEGCVVKNCPMQFDIADRVINQMSDPGDIVFDPFGGLMTVPYRAIKHGRYGMGVELATGYYQDGLFYCQQAVQERQMPSLFDFLDAEEDQLEYSLEEAV